MSQSEAARQLGIPDDAPVYSGSMPLPEGWSMDWLGVRVPNPPPRPWPWPDTVVGNRVGSIVVLVWSRTVHRPGFVYTVLWHPQRGRTYLANGSDPGTMPGLVREAQTRGTAKDWVLKGTEVLRQCIALLESRRAQ